MNKNMRDICDLIQELSWHFGNRGFNGECCEDLSLVEFMALKRIQGSENISIQEIGNTLNFTKSGASKIVDRIESKGYAVRMNSPIDGRVCCVLTTEKGKDTVAGVLGTCTSYLDNALKEIDSRKVEQIGEALEILVDAVHRVDALHRIGSSTLL